MRVTVILLVLVAAFLAGPSAAPPPDPVADRAYRERVKHAVVLFGWRSPFAAASAGEGGGRPPMPR